MTDFDEEIAALGLTFEELSLFCLARCCARFTYGSLVFPPADIGCAGELVQKGLLRPFKPPQVVYACDLTVLGLKLLPALVEMCQTECAARGRSIGDRAIPLRRLGARDDG